MQASVMESIGLAVLVFVVLLTQLCAGNKECDIEPCLHMFNNLKSLVDNVPSSSSDDQQLNESDADATNFMSSRICPLYQDLSVCIKSQSKVCRGDLYFHFVEKLLKDMAGRLSKNCSGPGIARNPDRGAGKHDRNASRHSDSHNSHRHNFDNGDSSKCLAKFLPTEPMVGCALYGVTNLKGFSDPLNITNIPYCSVSGAWSLIDTPEFTIQITNKGGFNPMPKDTTTTTLVTVIIRSNECSVRKTYQATFEEVPHMFSDGTTTAKNVYIETIRASEHVKIHLPYLMTTIDIFKLIGNLPIPSLSVAIKMPATNISSLLTNSKRIRGLPLCFYGCPKTATMRPRSVDHSTHKCPAVTTSTSSDSSSSSIVVTDSSSENSISSSVCGSLESVKRILSDVTVLEQGLKFPGEENYATMGGESESDINTNSKSKSFASNNDRFSTAENSALTSRSGSIFCSYRCCLFLYFSVISWLLYFS